MSGLDSTVQRLADLEAIRDLARRYAHSVWRQDPEGASSLFADDGVMETGDRPPLEGRAAIHAEYTQVFGQSDFHPFVHNHVIELDGDRATGTVYLDLRAGADGRRMIGYGFYRDDYVRTGEGWKFARRTLQMIEYAEQPLGEDGAS